MPTKIRPKNALKVSNIQQYLRNKIMRQSITYRITPTEEYYIIDGQKVSIEKFNILYPEISLIPVAKKGGNSDRTKNWIFDQKSF